MGVNGLERARSILDLDDLDEVWLALQPRFLVGDECWEWTRRPNTDGYARVFVKGMSFSAHRAVYELLVGRIPFGMTLDHLCRNRKCVNPGHLEITTSSVNTRRGGNATKTHCKHGHELTGMNLRVDPDGKRRCRTCIRDRMRRYRGFPVPRKAPISYCKFGHPYEGVNLIVGKDGHRYCRECMRRRTREYMRRRRKESEMSMSNKVGGG